MWWTEDGGHLLSSHSDGSYCRWMAGGEDVNEEEKSDIPYGEAPAAISFPYHDMTCRLFSFFSPGG